jgi:hypothetical protein
MGFRPLETNGEFSEDRQRTEESCSTSGIGPYCGFLYSLERNAVVVVDRLVFFGRRFSRRISEHCSSNSDRHLYHVSSNNRDNFSEIYQ